MRRKSPSESKTLRAWLEHFLNEKLIDGPYNNIPLGRDLFEKPHSAPFVINAVSHPHKAFEKPLIIDVGVRDDF